MKRQSKVKSKRIRSTTHRHLVDTTALIRKGSKAVGEANVGGVVHRNLGGVMTNPHPSAVQVVLDRKSGIVGVGRRYGEFSYNGLPLDSEIITTVKSSRTYARRKPRLGKIGTYVRRAGKQGIPSS